jgi:hypothetical protein
LGPDPKKNEEKKIAAAAAAIVVAFAAPWLDEGGA